MNSRSVGITSIHLRRMVISAMFLSLALVIRTLFRMYIPLFGESGIRISVHVIFSSMPAILFGPVYGAIVAGLTDFLGFHISPAGAYMPQMTLIAAFGGYLRGALWMLLRGKSVGLMRNCVIAFSLVLLAVGAYGMFSISSDGINPEFYIPYTLGNAVNESGVTVWDIDKEAIDTSNMSFVGNMLIANSINTQNPTARLRDFLTIASAMVGVGAFALLLVLIDWAANKFFIKGQTEISTMSLLVAMVVAAAVANLLNTAVLLHTLPAWQFLPFSVVAIPRLIQAVAAAILITYFVAMLLGICEKQPQLRELVKLK